MDSLESAGTPSRLPRLEHPMRWAFWTAVTVLTLGLAIGVALVSRPASKPSANESPVNAWPPGAQHAPDFSLTDQFGRPFNLASFRGRPVIVTFIDPLCRKYCPREASVLTAAAASLGKDAPAIVAVSVDPWGDSAENFRLDKAHWKLAPGWLWGTGTNAQLASVWKTYHVAVVVQKKTIAGITVRYITHTEAAYLIDPRGDERALLLYPFDQQQVVAATRTILATEPEQATHA